MIKKDGIVGLFEGTDGVFSPQKFQTIIFTFLLGTMVIATTFWDYKPTYEAWVVCSLGAGIGLVDKMNERKIKLNEKKSINQ